MDNPETTVVNFLNNRKDIFFNDQSSDSSWVIQRVLSGGNMNWSYLVAKTTTVTTATETGENSRDEQQLYSHQMVVKLAPPFVRCMGPTWQMSPQRAQFEAKTLQFYQTIVPHLAPQIYHFDDENAVMAMEYISDCTTLREFLIHHASSIPDKSDKLTFASDLGQFLAKTLFLTSDLCVPLSQKMEQVSLYAQNYQVCMLTDKVIFTEPYDPDCPHNNQWCKNTDGIRQVVMQIQENATIRKQVALLRYKFRSCPEALLHADLHTGSVLISESYSKRTTVIDTEFSFYGPMGFDIGKLIGNFLIAACCQKSKDTAFLILDQVKILWNTFVSHFENEWRQFEKRTLTKADCCAASRKPSTLLLSYQDHSQQFLHRVFRDSLGYAACAMIRRVIGVAPCPDLASIKEEESNRKIRAAKRILMLAEAMLGSCALGECSMQNIDQVADIFHQLW